MSQTTGKLPLVVSWYCCLHYGRMIHSGWYALCGHSHRLCTHKKLSLCCFFVLYCPKMLLFSPAWHNLGIAMPNKPVLNWWEMCLRMSLSITYWCFGILYHFGLDESPLDYPICWLSPVTRWYYLVRVVICSLHLWKPPLGVVSSYCTTHMGISLIVGCLSK